MLFLHLNMAINPAAVGTNAFELLDGSLSSFYAEVDEAIAASEVVKGQYRMTINPAYNSPNPVDSNSFTTVGLSQSGPMVVDLENSFITTNVEVLIKPDGDIVKPSVDSASIMFIGWKRSIEAIERYDILVNSTPIYTQSFCGEESFIMGQVDNDLVRTQSPFITSSYQNIVKMKPGVCGTYVLIRGPNPDGTNALTGANCINASTGINVKIPIKIPIANFPILKNLKYLLSWMGKWEIRLYFSAQNMIQCLVDPDVIKNAVNSPDGAIVIPHIYSDCKIKQLGEPLRQWHAIANNKASPADVIWHAEKMTLNDVSMNTAQFQIRMDVLEMLKQKYMMEKPLTFPVSTFQIARFTGPAQEKGQPLSIVLCQAINNCDTMFVLPFSKATEHTVCHNPNVTSLQLHAGEYGSYPTQPFNTYWDYGEDNIRFVNAAMDSLNINCSDLTSFSTDVGTSFVPYPKMVYSNGDASNPTTMKISINDKGKLSLGDDSNFFIPFPFSTDDDFQGGMSSPSSNINFKLTGTTSMNYTCSTPWAAVFLIDGVIMIRPDPGSDAAKVIWSDRTVC